MTNNTHSPSNNSHTTTNHSPSPPPPTTEEPTEQPKPSEPEKPSEPSKPEKTKTNYTQQLCQQIHQDINHFNQSLNSLTTTTTPATTTTTETETETTIIHQIIKLIQANNQHTLSLFQSSVQTIFSEVLDSVHTHFSLDRNQQQLIEIDRQIIANAQNSDQETRERLQAILIQQKHQLTKQITELQSHLTHSINKTHQQQQQQQQQQPSAAASSSSSSSSSINPNIHPNLQQEQEQTHPSSSSHPPQNSINSPTPTRTSSALLLTTKRKRAEQPTSTIEYDEALLDEFSIPDHLSYSQYLKRSQHRTLNLHHSISTNPTQPPISNDISVLPITPSSNNNNSPTGALNGIPSNSDPALTPPSFLPNPALLENYFKPCSSGSKSSRRQSAILRNLVSAALGKLISHVTNNQQMHWPGSDTEERLAAIGLQIELLGGSKLTTEVIHKGPKNLQLQQCKRILLELELGLIRLKQIKAVPRPLRGAKKKFKPLDSPQLSLVHPLHQSQLDNQTAATPISVPDILAIAPSSSSSSAELAYTNTAPSLAEQHSPNVLGKNFENCDPALLSLSPAFPGLVPSDQSGAQPTGSEEPRSTDHRDLVHRYMSSNVHPNNNPKHSYIDDFPNGDHEAFMDCDDDQEPLHHHQQQHSHQNHEQNQNQNHEGQSDVDLGVQESDLDDPADRHLHQNESQLRRKLLNV
ncbi:uncharacterized protein PGTG_17238 [Puccinia graminis f. sp. tritici CRL 75-36-700-3]|uniref:Uncharacterized protein n=1 Tax=Puccinia graminis f. sp. tritici (strain CRL 75-36-700-3 / race SCCL) TaxID=418459 RepID=E3L341_PUCGT|nr:uncharacterized protein PGTG_17238 [Puccinia graminis f. sp. tritici CRL 75-36-700-3]EFP90966.1 hypothetical protein PGTG_17238 [Puccinia graminis f. sp. tritici CRL 75-36-700-3]